MPKLDIAQREGNFREVELGLSEEVGAGRKPNAVCVATSNGWTGMGLPRPEPVDCRHAERHAMNEPAPVNLTINGRAVQARAGQTVYEAAAAAGIRIPVLCHHPRLKPQAPAAFALSRSKNSAGCIRPAPFPSLKAWSCAPTRPPSSRRAKRRCI